MNVGEVIGTIEQGLLLRQLSSLERFILCQSWLGRGYSEMAPDCAYSIAHIKDIGSQLWQAFSKALGERVTKKNLFLVLKQYLLSRTGETVNSDELPVTFSLVEVIDPPLTPTTNELSVATELMEDSYSEDSNRLPLVCDRPYLVTEESSQLERVQQKCQIDTDNPEAENNLKAPVTQSKPTISRARLPLDSPLYISLILAPELYSRFTVNSKLRSEETGMSIDSKAVPVNSSA
ncbi:MAG TPA: hypothetical protein DDW76_32345 [Cyanobacteria bacterium UBA11369]|nr:hypothetical protein [Cyanobacteria bacterium UBA11371]HBE35404.1 hypothetical protein [Cyanobacteria bacterium UBA11368]HBE53323.1 hypothetical protein [Cyanobacteria bacterium UBA11369]